MEDLLAGIPNEGDEPLEGEEKETPEESQPKETSEDTPSQEGEVTEEPKEESKEPENTPDETISQNRRTQERIESLLQDNRTLREESERYRNDFEKFKEEVSPRIQEKQPIPEWFSESFGENPDAWNKFQGWNDQQRKQIKEEVFRESEQVYKQEQEQEQARNQWTQDQLKGLKDSGKKFDDNELLATVIEYKPVNQEGNLDFNKAYEILELKKQKEAFSGKSVLEAKKKIASQTMEGSSSEESPKGYATPKDVRNKSWSDLAV